MRAASFDGASKRVNRATGNVLPGVGDLFCTIAKMATTQKLRRQRMLMEGLADSIKYQ